MNVNYRKYTIVCSGDITEPCEQPHPCNLHVLYSSSISTPRSSRHAKLPLTCPAMRKAKIPFGPHALQPPQPLSPNPNPARTSDAPYTNLSQVRVSPEIEICSPPTKTACCQDKPTICPLAIRRLIPSPLTVPRLPCTLPLEPRSVLGVLDCHVFCCFFLSSG